MTPPHGPPSKRMFRLTREVRIGINPDRPDESAGGPTNSYAGFPSLRGLGHFFTIQVTLAGELDARSSYLLNIKEVDRRVREQCVPLLETFVKARNTTGEAAVRALYDLLRDGWGRPRLTGVRLGASPFLAWATTAEDYPVVRLSQKFEFSATHRLHNPAMSEDENRSTYGKCNNPHGHGHNYEVQVTVAGAPGPDGVVMEVPAFERIVAQTVIDRFDHKNLNAELPEFRDVIPSVENIAMVIYRLLKPKLTRGDARLASVTVWETPKTWCEYTE